MKNEKRKTKLSQFLRLLLLLLLRSAFSL